MYQYYKADIKCDIVNIVILKKIEL